MTRFCRVMGILLVVATVSCVTVNIYFPSEKVRSAADRFVDEVWEQRTGEPAPGITPKDESSRLRWLTPGVAYAAQDIEVSTPRIEAIKASMILRARDLIPLLDSGHLGIDREGMIAIRTTEGLSLQQRAALLHLMDADNEDRLALYREIARANGFPDKVEEVQEIFARSWREKAAPGWHLEDAGGNWQPKGGDGR